MTPPSIATSRGFLTLPKIPEKLRLVALSERIGVKVKLSNYYHNNGAQNITIHSDDKM